MRWIALALLWLILVSPTVGFAADVLVRSSADPEEAWVGQRVRLKLDVLGQNGWAQISRLGEIDLPGAYVVRTESQGTRLQENIEGQSFTGQRYEFSIYPQRAGVIEVPELPLEATVKTWGADGGQHVQQVVTPAVTINVALPPGVKASVGLVSTSRLIAEQQWDPVSQEPRVGDALKRTVTRQADDVSGMAFTPLAYEDLPGLGIYPAEPLVEDSSNRGSLSGRRTETVTYVFERAGTVQIPDVTFNWWNTATEALETVTLPGESFVVEPGPATGDSSTAGRSENRLLSLQTLIMAGAFLLVAGVVVFGRTLLRSYRAWLAKRAASEPAFFARAVASVRTRNARSARRDVMRWLDQIDTSDQPAQLSVFASQYGTSEEQAIIEDFAVAVAEDLKPGDAQRLVQALGVMRARRLDSRRRRAEVTCALPDFN